jgi:16S rRNA (uracil1498-N3)-methyltransferase
MSARIHLDLTLAAGAELPLPANASRHLQVLRLQPGAPITLFDGRGGEWSAEVVDMGRKTVIARVLAHHAVERELATSVTLALGMPANERMDWLVEKATELGVGTIVPLVCERSVLRVAGDRAERKAAHWQAIAAAACEQSGRNRVPSIAPPMPLRGWLAACTVPPGAERRLVLSLVPGARGVIGALAGATGSAAGTPVIALSGPEGGLSPAELADAEAAGFNPITLGARVLRADTAPLALLAAIAALETTA